MAVWPYGDDRGTTGKPKYLARVDEALGQQPVKAFVIHEREYVVAPSTAEDEDVGDCPTCCNPYAPPPDPVCPGNCAIENFTAATLTATVRCRKNPVFEWRNFIPFCDSWEDMGYTHCTDPTNASPTGKLKCEAYTHLPEPRGGPPCGMSVSFYQPLYGGMRWWEVGKVLILGHVPPELNDEHWCDKMKRRIEANAGWGHENTQSCTNHGGPRVVISAGFGRIGTFNNYAGCRPSVSCSDCYGSFPVDAQGISNTQCAEQMGNCKCGNCYTPYIANGCSPNTAKDQPGGGYGGWPGDGLWEQTTSVDEVTGHVTKLGCFGMRGQVAAYCLANTTMSWVAKYALHPETPGDPVSEWKTCGELDMDVPSAGQWTQVSGVHPSGVAVRGDSGVWTSAALGLVIPQDSDACKIEIVDSPSHGDPFSNGTCGQCTKSDEIPCPDGHNCDPPYDCPQECVCGQANGVWLEFTGLEFVT